jgi:hypothetical protein
LSPAARPPAPEVTIGLNAVIVAVTAEVPRILTVEARGADGGARPLDALPYGPLDPGRHRTLERGLREWVREQSGLELGYAEQLYTFGDQHRDPRELAGGARVVSVAYLALAREAAPSAGAQWRGWYEFLPWEDWRGGRPPLLDREVAPALGRWAAAGAARPPLRRARRERVDIAFGLGGARWDGERVLERYELLYEAGLVSEARRDRRGGAPALGAGLGRPMALDHRRILATALARLRGKLRYRPVVFELLAPTFTLLQLQRLVEALAGVRLHKQNFRRLVENGGLVEGTGRMDVHTGGRPAELFRFRREVLRERPAPGVGLPAARP